MIIIIDGYNFLKALFPKIKDKLTHQREQLIKSLALYREKKEHEIVVVFDGGFSDKASREVHRGVVVVFAGQKRSADDWIVDYVKRNFGKEMMLISGDRGLAGRCRRFNIDVLEVHDFAKLLESVLLESIETSLSKKDDDISEIDSEALDVLMEQSGVNSYEKDDNYEDRAKKGKSYTRSKEEKRIWNKIKKM